MNIAIEQTEEYVNGQLKNKYGDAFLRGNNGESSHFITHLQSFYLIQHTIHNRCGEDKID